MYLPAQTWDQMLDWWLRLTEEYIDLIKRHPLFLQWMGISLQQHLVARRRIELIMERVWRQAGLPPLQEITRLHERMTLLESKLNGLRKEEGFPGMVQPLPEEPGKTSVHPLRKYA